MPRIPNNLGYYAGEDRVKMEEYYYWLQLKHSHGWAEGEYDNILSFDSSKHIFSKEEKEDNEVEQAQVSVLPEGVSEPQ